MTFFDRIDQEPLVRQAQKEIFRHTQSNVAGLDPSYAVKQAGRLRSLYLSACVQAIGRAMLRAATSAGLRQFISVVAVKLCLRSSAQSGS